MTISHANPKARTHVRLACRLRQKAVINDRVPLQNQGELELENLSEDVVEIAYQMSPLQYLDLVVTGPSGSVISERYFGDRFSPMREERVLRLQSGEKFVHDVPLMGTVPREKRVAGVYKVQAVYEYEGGRVVSEPVELTL